MELQELINSVKIEEYISQFIDLEEQNGELVGLSPFCKESTPSFTITRETQLFCDFAAGSHKGGNILSFIELYHKCSFIQAINILKKYLNITEEYVDTRLSATKTIKKYRTKVKKTEVTHKVLPSDTMTQYEKDFNKLQGWIDEGITKDILEKYEVRYDPFSEKIVFPIRDLHGNIISVKGRTTVPDYKEKKIAKYIYFQRIGDIDFLFGYYEHLQSILDSKFIILFEGEKSVMKCDAWGINNTTAILTSHLNPTQLPVLIKLGVRVVFALDKEINIKNDENIQKLKRFVKVEYIDDCDSLLTEKQAPVDAGKEIWDKLYEGRKSVN